MENGVLVLSIIIGVIGVIAFTNAVVFPKLAKKGFNIREGLETATLTAETANVAFDALKGILPKNEAINTIDKVLDLAVVGAKKAEQLYYINQIDGEQRKQEATSFVEDALKLSGVEITPDIQKIIDGAIEASVYSIGHKK